MGLVALKEMRQMMRKRKSKKKKILAILLSVIFLMVIGWWAFCVKMYDDNFNVRGDSYQPLLLRLEDFEGLNCKEYTFSSDNGQKLAGYLYSIGDNQHGIVVIAHGFGGGGHNSYMDVANYFAENGYYVFAYDATGCDKSEGEGVGGVPQGVIDLDYAISFVEDNNEIPDLPIVLFGHSWGGYCVSSVLTYHPEVKAVIECSGFNKSSDMFESGGKSQAGDIIYAMMTNIMKNIRTIHALLLSDLKTEGITKYLIIRPIPTKMNLMPNLTSGLKHLIMIMKQKRIRNALRKIRRDI